eukprot:1154535-Pelagomonas_calceolata.AAC.1
MPQCILEVWLGHGAKPLQQGVVPEGVVVEPLRAHASSNYWCRGRGLDKHVCVREWSVEDPLEMGGQGRHKKTERV